MNRNLKILLLAAFTTLPGATFADVICPTDVIWMNCTNGLWTAYVPYDGFKQLTPYTPCSSTPTAGAPTHTGEGTTYHFEGQLQVATAYRYSNHAQSPCNYSEPTTDQLKCTYNANMNSSSPTPNAVVIQRVHSSKEASFDKHKCSQWLVGGNGELWGYPYMYYCYGNSTSDCKGVYTGSSGGFWPEK